MAVTAPAGVLTAAGRRFLRARGVLGSILLLWLATAAIGAAPTIVALERLTAGLAGGSAELAKPGGTVAFEALLRGVKPLSFSLSFAGGTALLFVLLLEPLARGAWLCAVGRCHRGCAARRGLWQRGAHHLLRLALLKPLVWAAGGLAAAGLLAAGFPAVVVLPAVWLLAGLAHDLAAALLVTSPGVREVPRRFVEFVRTRPGWLLVGGSLFRVASLAPLLLLAVAVAAGPAGGALRPVVLLLLPMVTLTVRLGWLALLQEISAVPLDNEPPVA